ncbi:integrin beta-1-binding protein 1-like [Liolophura sinensis]|uniref:integrin beta-1-binding protein 1-like n=1 Tax=Liolophura sinensis TaxID=3198878 RepID=UPI0031581E26
MFGNNMNRRKKPNAQNGSKESVASSGEMSGSSLENISGPREGKEGLGLSGDMPPSKMLGITVQFQVYYLGMVQDIHMPASAQRDNEAQLIDYVEEAQMQGKLPITAKDKDTVILNVSRHGIKVLDSARQEVMQRHPLHTIAQALYYDDGFGKTNVAIKIGQVGRRAPIFQCYVFQCHSEDQSQAICQSLKQLFDAITQRHDGV